MNVYRIQDKESQEYYAVNKKWTHRSHNSKLFTNLNLVRKTRAQLSKKLQPKKLVIKIYELIELGEK